ncbi:MAG: fused MFS/spermidine synthase [Burkholderiaceae bacterium]|nr:fused MFS/spermidine synthase [Burkholderiaceae bacterium]
MTPQQIFATAVLALVSVGGTVAGQDEKFQLTDTVYQQKSLYRNILVVEGEGYRCMKFGRFHARQTCIQIGQPQRLVLNYTKGLLASLYLAEQAPRRVLILGLGGGVMPMALRMLDADIEIDTVELDPAVVKVAQSHFAYQEDAKLHTHVQDARVFVRQQQRRRGIQYDLVLIDAFDRDYIPEHLLTREFLQQVRSLLTPAGVLAANTFAAGALARHEAATYQAVFDQLYQLDMDGGNRILLARRDTLPPLPDVQRYAQAWDGRLALFRLLSADLLPRLALQPRALGVKVLTDQYSPSNLLLP